MSFVLVAGDTVWLWICLENKGGIFGWKLMRNCYLISQVINLYLPLPLSILLKACRISKVDPCNSIVMSERLFSTLKLHKKAIQKLNVQIALKINDTLAWTRIPTIFKNVRYLIFMEAISNEFQSFQNKN